MDGNVRKKNVQTHFVTNAVGSWCIVMIAVNTSDRFWVGFIFGAVFNGGVFLAITDKFYLGMILVITSIYFTYEYLRKKE